MKIKLTQKAERGIGLRSMSTGKLTRYEAGDELIVTDAVAVGLINSGFATEIEEDAPDEEINDDKLDSYDEEDDAKSYAPDEEDDISFANMTKEQLIAICKEKGINPVGSKKELIDRLTEV